MFRGQPFSWRITEQEERVSLLVSDNPLEILKDIPLAPLTTLKIGGPARFFVKAQCEADVVEALEYAKNEDLKVFVLGGGSNILVSDGGFDGLVLQIALKGRTTPSADASATPPRTGGELTEVTAQAGEDWDEFVNYCVGRGFAGIECLSGIPGFVGGTPVQNVGAYGQEVSETIVSVRCLDRTTNSIVDLTNQDCGFGYRASIFNSTKTGRYIVLSVTFLLTSGGAAKIAYKELKDLFASGEPTLTETREAVLRIRAAKSMVIDEKDPNSRSCGSFFKNPIVSREKLAETGEVPHFNVDAASVKIPAAWLIEKAGFHKGFVMGNAGISSNHSLAIVNRGTASANDILALKDKIVSGVDAKFGIVLTPEPIFVGF